MRKNVGYFEGTDSTLLTDLVCEGYDTVPISNGYDNHGMNVRIINKENRVDVLVGYVHKIFAPDDDLQPGGVSYQDIFHVCRTFDVPLLLEVQTELHDRARALFDDIPDCVHFVDPSDMIEEARKVLA
ncbi:MAG: hypothetical protein ABFR89_12580 [Actinomycetota bacterium]